MLVLIVLAGILGVVAFIGVTWWFYMDGRADAEARYRAYHNDHSGYAAWLYDLGYNSVAAAKSRAAANLERNRARMEVRG